MMSIPREHIEEMIRLCLDNAIQFLKDAELIHSQKPKKNHAIAFVQFAVEEIGKASILKKKSQETQENVVSIPNKIFFNHLFKEKEAWTILNPKLRNLVKAAFDPAFFDSEAFSTKDIPLSTRERLKCLFVDFKNGKPTLGAYFEKENLKEMISGIKKEIFQLKESWLAS